MVWSATIDVTNDWSDWLIMGFDWSPRWHLLVLRSPWSQGTYPWFGFSCGMKISMAIMTRFDLNGNNGQVHHQGKVIYVCVLALLSSCCHCATCFLFTCGMSTSKAECHYVFCSCQSVMAWVPLLSFCKPTWWNTYFSFKFWWHTLSWSFRMWGCLWYYCLIENGMFDVSFSSSFKIYTHYMKLAPYSCNPPGSLGRSLPHQLAGQTCITTDKPSLLLLERSDFCKLSLSTSTQWPFFPIHWSSNQLIQNLLIDIFSLLIWYFSAL
jgi:hypothetical protein